MCFIFALIKALTSILICFSGLPVVVPVRAEQDI
ncbi:hypothetical protein E2C01_075666 [Portunus trituberculatus]|uniref:Uncharacterized protein n=1 Tax=Portunus trituberculatus TaxID=210409 RepID=A0A5B7IGD5_PORTR|nr:hypothetical protein [Portunus trituberculatus]